MPCIECPGGVIICNSDPKCPTADGPDGGNGATALSANGSSSAEPVASFSLVFIAEDEDRKRVHLFGIEKETGEWTHHDDLSWAHGTDVAFTAERAYRVSDLDAIEAGEVAAVPLSGAATTA